jgi:hypothetical protein
MITHKILKQSKLSCVDNLVSLVGFKVCISPLVPAGEVYLTPDTAYVRELMDIEQLAKLSVKHIKV